MQYTEWEPFFFLWERRVWFHPVWGDKGFEYRRRRLSARVTFWFAKRFGKRHEWKGPTIQGVGYEWRGAIHFDPVRRKGKPHD